MKILAFIFVLIGAIISYGAKYIVEKILKKTDADGKYISIIKVLGFILVLIGAVLVFKFA